MSAPWYDPTPGERIAITLGGGPAAAAPTGCFFHLTDTTWVGTPPSPLDSPELYFAGDGSSHLDYQAGYIAPNDYWGSDVSSLMPALTLDYASDGRPILPPGTYYVEYDFDATLVTPLTAGAVWSFKISGINNTVNSRQYAVFPAGVADIQAGFSSTFTVFEADPTGVRVAIAALLTAQAPDFSPSGMSLWMTLLKVA